MGLTLRSPTRDTHALLIQPPGPVVHIMPSLDICNSTSERAESGLVAEIVYGYNSHFMTTTIACLRRCMAGITLSNISLEAYYPLSVFVCLLVFYVLATSKDGYRLMATL